MIRQEEFRKLSIKTDTADIIHMTADQMCLKSDFLTAVQQNANTTKWADSVQSYILKGEGWSIPMILTETVSPEKRMMQLRGGPMIP